MITESFSSIMPGKVNPVIPEVVNQVAFNVIGNDMAITMAAEAGQLELNAFEPIVFYNLFQSIDTLGFATETFVDNCVSDLFDCEFAFDWQNRTETIAYGWQFPKKQ